MLVVSCSAELLLAVRVLSRHGTPAGISAQTAARNVGAAAEPEAGPRNAVFAVWVANPRAHVPDVVIVQPEVVRIEGTVTATLVTVPPPLEPPSWTVPAVSANVAICPAVIAPVTDATVAPPALEAFVAAVPSPKLERAAATVETSDRLLAGFSGVNPRLVAAAPLAR